MLYITRSRYKESLRAEDIAGVNRLLDSEVIPAIQKVEGVRSCQGYNSINGEIVLVLDIENMATVDRILGSGGVAGTARELSNVLMRTGGEVMYDRPAWQGLYGSSE